MNESNTFIWQGITLTYEVLGHGPEKILAFHGFGQNASAYRSWGSGTENRITIYSINLFFHGSDWPYRSQPLEPGIEEGLFKAFLEKNRIENFSLLAYSIGARLAFELLKIFPDRIGCMFLIAPDGIRLNFWYRFATGFPPARWLFWYSVDHPGIFLTVLEWTGKLKIIHASVGRFALSQMKSREKREKVYLTWMVFRRMKAQTNLLTKIISQKKLKVLIFAGEKDNVILSGPLDRFSKKTGYCKLVLLPVNHHQLIDSAAAWFRDQAGSP